MSKNAQKIAQGLLNISHRPYEVMSGTVVPGSVDEDACTCAVHLTNMDQPVEGVLLNSKQGNTQSFIQFPADNSDVVIAALDGGGEHILLSTSVLNKAIVKIGQSAFNITADGYKMEHNGESLTDILKDMLEKIMGITVTTGTGPSGPPINAADFADIQSRLQNLLL